MNASSTIILQTGIDAITSMFIGLLTFAISNWIPIVLSIVIVVGAIGFLYGKAQGLFRTK